MYTIVETPTFGAMADKLWSEDERTEFLLWLAANPEAGDGIPGERHYPGQYSQGNSKGNR
jgi:hypothetical protein